ncbi:hypothetical protein B0J13DRAFT_171939 [Dactylonectria estremocensis]|uniref:Uncharacterized protein n=1 Tax=Dactylonectria estremocensis TaxID=1079267 RepID=A0A9P9FB81_9HYPO|nr:hypothetical protein B0J13DRAFT_171939 [Dactylonectria estremocensis]
MNDTSCFLLIRPVCWSAWSHVTTPSEPLLRKDRLAERLQAVHAGCCFSKSIRFLLLAQAPRTAADIRRCPREMALPSSSVSALMSIPLDSLGAQRTPLEVLTTRRWQKSHEQTVLSDVLIDRRCLDLEGDANSSCSTWRLQHSLTLARRCQKARDGVVGSRPKGPMPRADGVKAGDDPSSDEPAVPAQLDKKKIKDLLRLSGVAVWEESRPC